MASFSITDAAFSGFRLIRDRPATIATWILLNIALAAGVLASAFQLGGADLTRIAALGHGGASVNPGEAVGLIERVAPLYAVALLLSLFVRAMFRTAVNRMVLRPDERRFAYLRLGADEMRQFALMLLWFVIIVAAWIAIMIGVFLAAVVLGLAGALIALAVHAIGPHAGGGFMPFLAPMFGICLLGLPCAMVFVLVRLSLASPLTFAKRRIDLFGSWALTRGRFWALLGTYLITALLVVIVWLTGMIVVVVAILAFGGGFGAVGALFAGGATTFKAMYSISGAVYGVWTEIFSALAWSLTRAPMAHIYQSLTAPGTEAPPSPPDVVSA
jgi:hypothetical protein